MALKFQLFKIYYLVSIIGWSMSQSTHSDDKPNVVIIMADDMGFDDVSFRGSSNFLTPNIDALAYSGIILNNLYVAAMCTPSRAALLTGKYPINTGMQNYVIVNDQPWGLPVNETTMAQIFQQNGYYTSLFGKWHLGMSRKAYTPTLRGFDHHFGYLGAYIDYYDQTYFSATVGRGHDFRKNLTPSYTHAGKYVTDVLTDATVELIEHHNVTEKPLFILLSHLGPHAANTDNPMQAPEEEIKRFDYIKSKTRQKYAAMVSRVDRSVGLVIDALARRHILNNTIILFLSDNGGPTFGEHATKASNYPLRGQKHSPWEGAIRSSAAIWSTQFEKLSTVWTQPFYIGDLLPTLAAAAKIHIDEKLKLDGLNLWSALKYGYQSVEREIVHNINDQMPYFSFLKGKWKLINGTTFNGSYDGWLTKITNNSDVDPRAFDYEEVIENTTVWQHLQHHRPPNQLLPTNIHDLRNEATIRCQFLDSTSGTLCEPLKAPCLFDLEIDPCEQNNLYDLHRNTSVVIELMEKVEKYRQSAHQPNNKNRDPNCNPSYYNNEWTWWEEEERSTSNANNIKFRHFKNNLGHYISVISLLCLSLIL